MTLPPLREGPDPDEDIDGGGDSKAERWGQWMKKGQICRPPAVSTSSTACQRSDLRLLLGVLGAPLAPVHVSSSDGLPHLSINNTPIGGEVGVVDEEGADVGRGFEDQIY